MNSWPQVDSALRMKYSQTGVILFPVGSYGALMFQL